MSPAVRLSMNHPDHDDLLDAGSPHLSLSHPSASELHLIWSETAQAWGKHLSLSGYIERESRCKATALARDGGITHWVLVAAGSLPDQRVIYASCESYRKRVWFQRAGEAQRTPSIGLAHCVGSVWCSPVLRGRGYASRMIRDLGAVLESWQTDQGKVVCSVLYSDIGKRWYARYGWHPFDCRHVEFPVTRKKNDHVRSSEVQARPLDLDGLKPLCAKDSSRLVQQLSSLGDDRSRILFVPDFAVFEWFCTREDVATRYLLDQEAPVKGVLAGHGGSQMWAMFNRSYAGPIGVENAPNTLYILRLVIEDPAAHEANIASFQAIIELARTEAGAWSLDVVQLWNPSPAVLDLIRHCKIEHTSVVREEDSIPCLRCYGDADEAVEWMSLEKYCWC